jgi:hypothetical protein
VEQDEHFEVPQLWQVSEASKEFRLLQLQHMKAVQAGPRSILNDLGFDVGYQVDDGYEGVNVKLCEV